jgi:hypothetical protein
MFKFRIVVITAKQAHSIAGSFMMVLGGTLSEWST